MSKPKFIDVVNILTLALLEKSSFSILGFRLDIISTEYSELCSIACERNYRPLGREFEPATPAFWCRCLNHWTNKLVEIKRQIRIEIAVGTAMHQRYIQISLKR
jgi:hypothetical protein